MKTLFSALPLLCALLLLHACSGDKPSPEEEIRRFIDAGVEAAEDRSTDDLAEMVHPNYIDQKGYNRKQLKAVLTLYFLQHKNIHLFTRIKTIDLLSENRAEVVLYVAMAGSVIADVDALAALRARVYRFELQLVRNEVWLLQNANWAPAGLADLN